MRNFLYHLFCPRESNNHRSKILHIESLFIVVLLILISIVPINFVEKRYPTVLGAYSDISFQDLLLLTNQDRIHEGLDPLTINDQLSKAADNKAQDMFTNNYWSHISPTGTTPWDFIKGTGYDYVYAGENLARGFTNAPDVVSAWMASPEHRENMLSRNFKDVGFAVREGVLNGENTTLVVEELGGKTISPPVGKQTTLSTTSDSEKKPITVNRQVSVSALNSQGLSKNFIEIILGIFIFTLILDLVIVERKKIVRITSHNLDHIIFLIIIFVAVVILSHGVTL